MNRLAERLRDMEAVVALAVAALLVARVPFRLVARLAGQVRSGAVPAGPAPDPAAAGVARSIRRAAVRVPWQVTCLVQALAGRMMLARRGIASAICVGVTREGNEVKAHAWLVANGGTVCGGREADRFVPIAAFMGEHPHR